MSGYFLNVFLVPFADDPVTGPGGIPTELLTGPYGFLVIIFVCAYWGLREWRKGREQDVETFRRRFQEAEARANAAESKSDSDVVVLTSKIEALQGDIRTLRDQHFREQEASLAKYYAARQMLLAAGVPKEDIP